MTFKIKNIFFITLILVGFYIFFIEYFDLRNIKFKKINYNPQNNVQDINDKTEIYEKNFFEDNKKNIPIINLEKIELVVSKGDTFFSILKKFNFTNNKIYKIIDTIENFYNLKNLKVNDKLIFYKNSNDLIKKIEIDLEVDTRLIINIDEEITAQRKVLKKLSYQESHQFKITNSLYADGLKNELPQNILMKLIKLFSFDLDFQRDIKKNTLVSVSFNFNEIEENNKIEYGDIKYALISIEGKNLEYFRFLTDDGFIDYFNREGKNVKKSILKTPLDGARLSSSFGMRKHPISGYNKMHKGVDFAAPKGTPVYAGGNGVIEYVGKNGGYGNYIRIRHNNEYKTAYAHLSGFQKGISKGVRVNQGDIIGFVGSTGKSTGPHLHYEIIFQNEQINPLKLKLPSGKTLKGNELKRFKKEYRKIFADHLFLLYE